MKSSIVLYLMLLLTLQVTPQGRKAMTIDDLASWNRITEKVISDDGTLVVFKTEPSQGDPVVTLYDGNARLKATFKCATGVTVATDSRFLFFTIKLPEDEVRASETYHACHADCLG